LTCYLQVEVPGPRKSVGAEVNYGIRFSEHSDAVAFIRDLSEEVEKRLAIAGARGRTVTLKLKRCVVFHWHGTDLTR
jgi:DNA repair protein REV1